MSYFSEGKVQGGGGGGVDVPGIFSRMDLPQVEEPATPTLSIGAGLGFFGNDEGFLELALNGVAEYLWDDKAFCPGKPNGPSVLNVEPSDTVPGHSFFLDQDTGLGTAGPNINSLIAGGVEGYRMDTALKHSFAGEVVIGAPIGTAPNGALEVVGPQSGVVGGFAAGELQIRSSSTSAFAGAVITGHNSSGLGNKQVWYFGSISSSNANIALINRETSGTLEFWTQNTQSLKVDKSGGVTIPRTTGFLRLPNMTTAQRNGLTILNGMMIYNTTTQTIQIVVNLNWRNIVEVI